MADAFDVMFMRDVTGAESPEMCANWSLEI